MSTPEHTAENDGSLKLLNNVPANLTHLGIDDLSDCLWGDIGQRLKNSAFLPKLRFLDCAHLNHDDCDVIDGLATMLPETGHHAQSNAWS